MRNDNSARTVLLVCCAGLLLIFAVAAFAPGRDDDPVPSTWNTGKGGAKAALLLLPELGYHALASEEPLTRRLDAISAGEAKRTTVVLAEPEEPGDALKGDQAAINRFLQRGGSVLAAGSAGAALLGRAPPQPPRNSARHTFGDVCLTTPEGQSALARAGAVLMVAPEVWAEDPSTEVSVAQRCGGNPVVVRWQAGTGTATWWASATPLTNQGLHEDGSLRLLLSSLAPAASANGEPLSEVRNSSRTILFDESLHTPLAATSVDPLEGLPLPLLLDQAFFVAALMLFSLGRRYGPVRAPEGRRRTSPVEFVYSMGGLYSRAGATGAPIEAAERRLRRSLSLIAGLSPATLSEGPLAIQAALEARLGPAEPWEWIARDLDHAAAATTAEKAIPEGEALTLVRALDSHTRALPQLVSKSRGAGTPRNAEAKTNDWQIERARA